MRKYRVFLTTGQVAEFLAHDSDERLLADGRHLAFRANGEFVAQFKLELVAGLTFEAVDGGKETR